MGSQLTVTIWWLSWTKMKFQNWQNLCESNPYCPSILFSILLSNSTRLCFIICSPNPLFWVAWSMLWAMMLKSFHLQISCHYTFQPLSSCGNKFQICTVPNLFFSFFPVGQDLCSLYRLKCKNNVPIGWTCFKNNISPRQGSSDNFLRIDCEKISFFWSLKNPVQIITKQSHNFDMSIRKFIRNFH